MAKKYLITYRGKATIGKSKLSAGELAAYLNKLDMQRNNKSSGSFRVIPSPTKKRKLKSHGWNWGGL